MNEYIQKPPSVRKSGADAGKSGAERRERITPPESDDYEGATYYDKGENDEQCFAQISSETCPRSIYRHIVLYSDKKVNTFFKLFQKFF